MGERLNARIFVKVTSVFDIFNFDSTDLGSIPKIDTFRRTNVKLLLWQLGKILADVVFLSVLLTINMF